MDLLHQIFECGHVITETNGPKPAINRWLVGFLKYRSKINKEGRGRIKMSRLYYSLKINKCHPVLPLFLENSEYKLSWAHKLYFSHVHRTLGSITPSKKRVCLFSNNFKEYILVSLMIQWILSQDIQCRHFYSSKHLGEVSQSVKACVAGRQGAMNPCFSAIFLMDISDCSSSKDSNNISPLHFLMT